MEGGFDIASLSTEEAQKMGREIMTAGMLVWRAQQVGIEVVFDREDEHDHFEVTLETPGGGVYGYAGPDLAEVAQQALDAVTEGLAP